MTAAEHTVSVEVPASCANLGPGFDALAVAVDVTLRVWTIERGVFRVTALGEGKGELPTDDTNLIWRALVAYCDRFGVAVPAVSLEARCDIPLERGMGSSAAAAVAGVALGRALTRGGGGDQDLVDLAAELEGHPDNAAAAVLGGLVVVCDGRASRLTPSERLRPVLAVPAQRQPTAAARAVLPKSVRLADAAANGARAALVLAGLAGATALATTAMRDVLHEPPRFAAMPESGRLVEQLRADGLAACLSGAGPSVLAVVPASDTAAVDRLRAASPDAWEVLPLSWHLAGAAVREPDRPPVTPTVGQAPGPALGS